MHYEETLQLIENFKQHPFEGSLIVVGIAALFAYLIYIDRRKR
ncbi:hypothetical protein [Anaerobacterium chartisolvens]|nr:hypothetical protein [Anaerobacterium chartisolvens]